MSRLAVALLLLVLPASLAAQDTLVVRADNPPVWGARPKLVEELRIGVLEGDPDYSLGTVSDLIEMPDGSVWVADWDLGAIRRYSAEGKALGRVGRRGAGPGEFESIVGLGLLPSGEVVVADVGNARMSVLDREGRPLRTFRLPGASIIAEAVPVPQLRVTSAGEISWFGAVRAAETARPEGLAAPGTRIATSQPQVNGWFRISPTGEVVDSVPRQKEVRGRVLRMVTHTLLAPAGYPVQGRNEEYAIHRPLRDGRVVRIERSWVPVPIEAEEREELQAVLDWAKSDESVPRTKPSWSGFGLDDAGRIWVSRYVRATQVGESDARRDARLNPLRAIGVSGTQGRRPIPAVTWGQPEVLDVIEPSGRYLGTVTLPHSEAGDDVSPYDRTRVLRAHDLTIWALEFGTLGESYVVKYRIVTGS